MHYITKLKVSVDKYLQTPVNLNIFNLHPVKFYFKTKTAIPELYKLLSKYTEFWGDEIKEHLFVTTY